MPTKENTIESTVAEYEEVWEDVQEFQSFLIKILKTSKTGQDFALTTTTLSETVEVRNTVIKNVENMFAMTAFWAKAFGLKVPFMLMIKRFYESMKATHCSQCAKKDSCEACAPDDEVPENRTVH